LNMMLLLSEQSLLHNKYRRIWQNPSQNPC
jgi:hypothetical protein